MTVSAIYEGKVYHHRLAPREHRFGYSLSLFYLDLDELPNLLAESRLWSSQRFNVAWFRRSDYLGSAGQPLREAVLERVEDELGFRPEGPVRLVTQVRTLGYVFNPVSFYFCHASGEPDSSDDSAAAGALEAIVAEITNTPWGERHAYVLDARSQAGSDPCSWEFAKDFHVSPFFDMGQVYRWRFGVPGERLEVHMTNREGGVDVFHAGVSCERHALTARRLRSSLLRFPLQTVKVHAAIYWQAARLFLKRVPFFTHPRKRVAPTRAPIA